MIPIPFLSSLSNIKLHTFCIISKMPQNKSAAFQTVDKVALEFTSQSNFSFMKQILYKIKFLRVFLSFNSPLFSLIFASFFKFIHAYVHFIVLVSFGMSSVNSLGSPPDDDVLSLLSSSLSLFSFRGFFP